MSDWFSSLASQAMQFADSLADSIAEQAKEAQQQIQEEQKKLQEEENMKNHKLSTLSALPWETDDESLAILSQDLMEQIFLLSVNEENFNSTSVNSKEVYFNFKDFVPAAMNLLKLDSNLARVHSKLSPKMDEEVFWFNYFCRVVYLRDSIGMNGPEAKQASSKYKRTDIIYEPKAIVPPVKTITPPTNLSSATSNYQTAKREYSSPTSQISTISNNSKKSVVLVKSEEEQLLAAEVHAALRSGESSEGFSGELIDESELIGDEEIDLGDLDDLLDVEESVDFEQIGKSDCNETEEESLEAQIAKELMMQDD